MPMHGEFVLTPIYVCPQDLLTDASSTIIKFPRDAVREVEFYRGIRQRRGVAGSRAAPDARPACEEMKGTSRADDFRALSLSPFPSAQLASRSRTWALPLVVRLFCSRYAGRCDDALTSLTRKLPSLLLRYAVNC